MVTKAGKRRNKCLKDLGLHSPQVPSLSCYIIFKKIQEREATQKTIKPQILERPWAVHYMDKGTKRRPMSLL
jgi:hypothetical protein